MGIVTPLFALSGAGVDGGAAVRVRWTAGPTGTPLVAEARNKGNLVMLFSAEQGARAAPWPPEIFLEEDERF